MNVVVAGDIRDPHRVQELCKDVEVVFHLAALIAIPYSYHSPDSYVETNVKGTLNVLQAARKQSVEQIIHTSTSEVYGTAQRVPVLDVRIAGRRGGQLGARLVDARRLGIHGWSYGGYMSAMSLVFLRDSGTSENSFSISAGLFK